jgi:hypothetical protein
MLAGKNGKEKDLLEAPPNADFNFDMSTRHHHPHARTSPRGGVTRCRRNVQKQCLSVQYLVGHDEGDGGRCHLDIMTSKPLPNTVLVTGYCEALSSNGIVVGQTPRALEPDSTDEHSPLCLMLLNAS